MEVWESAIALRVANIEEQCFVDKILYTTNLLDEK